MKGKIMKGISGFYYVNVVESGIYECKAKGIFRKDKIKPLVGDDVEIEVLSEEKKIGNIIKIFPRHSELVRPALEFMMDNFQENISISQLAALSNLSKSYFMGCFKKAVGVGAIEHLTQLRVNAACEALTDTDKTISDVALDCGYSNLSNFNRQFKKITGSTPNEYRRNIKSVR